MRFVVAAILLTLAFAACASNLARGGDPPPVPLSDADKTRFFEERVRPVLANNCFKCHGSKQQKGDVRLDYRDAMMPGSDFTEVIVPGDPEFSRLVEVIRYSEDDIQMPPKGRLPQKDIDALVTWVSIGAPWPAGDPAPATTAEMGENEFEEARRTHWAYQPVTRPPLPDVADLEQAAMPMDRFVQARLESAGLSFSPEADRKTLIRRATFDLTGLPPTAAEVDAFVNDDSPDAYARLVDRLLASPHYGERWGRHWLDVARYADTKGLIFARERGFPYAYTYRDYVIRAFNNDVPYNRFVMEQIAADQLNLDDDRALAAMGFLTVGRRFGTDLPEVIDDRIDVVSRGLLGLTVSCARCHDHKYDAIPTADYYSLYGVFASSREPLTLPLLADPEAIAGYPKFREAYAPVHEEFVGFLNEQYKLITGTARKRVADYLIEVVTKEAGDLVGKSAFLSLSPDELKPELIVRWRNYLDERAVPTDPVFGPWRALMRLDDAHFDAQAGEVIAGWMGTSDSTPPGELNPLVKDMFSKLQPSSKLAVAQAYGQLITDVYLRLCENDEIDDSGKAAGECDNASAEERQILDILLAKDSPTNLTTDDIPGSLARIDNAKYLELTSKLASIEVHSSAAPPRAMVMVDAPQPYDPVVFVRGNPTRPGKPVPRQFLRVLAGEDRQPFQQGSGRLELARAIVADDNPLTARVLVNRVWMHHFGEPLVQTPSDFGAQCDPPSHPELLDYLAWTFREQGWSLKQLHREMMLSRTYRQTSFDRPECRSENPDNSLYWRMNRQRLEFEAMRDAVLTAAGRLDESMQGQPADILSEPFSMRRTVYALVDRQDLPGLYRIFDFANPDHSAAERARTTVPQQALFAMNSLFIIEQSEAASKQLSDRDNRKDRLQALYRRILSRNPTQEELRGGLAFIEAASNDEPLTEDNANQGTSGMGAWEQLAQVLLCTNEFLFVD